MNRHQRRAAERKSYRAGIQAMVDEVRGAIKISTIRPEDYLAMLADVAGGYMGHAPLLGTVAEVVAKVRNAPASDPMICAACPAPLTGGFAVVVAQAARITPVNGIAVGVCLKCGPDLASIEAAALKGLQAIWPDLAPKPIHDQAGHA